MRLTLFLCVTLNSALSSECREHSGQLFFFSTFQVLSLKIILAFFDVQVKADTLPRKGCYFNSPSQFRKTLKIKALRKDPKALAKNENVVQLGWMKGLFNQAKYSN